MNKTILFGFAVFTLMGIVLAPISYSDVPPPKKQTSLGITADEIFCKDGFIKVTLSGKTNPSCIKLSSVDKLSKLNKVKNIDLATLDKVKQMDREKPGSVNLISSVKIPTNVGKLKSNSPASGYDIVFEVCSKEMGIRQPQVVIVSDSQTKYVNLVINVPPNSCEISADFIKASNPETISLSLSNQGTITSTLNTLENKVNSIKEQLASEKIKLATLLAQKDSSDFKVQSKTITDTIVSLRTQLNDAREEFNRYQFALNVIPTTTKASLAIPKSFIGTPIEGVQVNIINTSEQRETKGIFNVAFEMCAGKDMIRIPVVNLSSDSETKAIKLADKIAPNSCQLTGAKINATDSSSIVASVSETSKNSNIVNDLETKIRDLETSIKAEKENLKTLVHNPKRPADFEHQLVIISDNIVDLRNQIHETKVHLHKYLNQVYE